MRKTITILGAIVTLSACKQVTQVHPVIQYASVAGDWQFNEQDAPTVKVDTGNNNRYTLQFDSVYAPYRDYYRVADTIRCWFSYPKPKKLYEFSFYLNAGNPACLLNELDLNDSTVVSYTGGHKI